MALLLNYSEQQTIKPISQNNEARYAQIALEVEEFEVKKILGVRFLQSIQAAPTSEYNSKLLNGDTLEDGSNHKGLKYVIAYLNYSRYVGESYIKDTFTGFRKQTTEQSEYLSEGEIKRLQNLSREIALTEFDLIKEWLNENTANFEFWNSSSEKKAYTPRLYSVRKTEK